MSTRKTVFDKIKNELATISSVGAVKSKAESWSETHPSDFDLLIVHDEVVDRERIAFYTTKTALDDMAAMMELSVHGRVYKRAGHGETESAIDTLLGNVEATLVTSSCIGAQTVDVMAQSDETDKGITDNFGFFDARYLVTYHYNHTSP